MTESFRIAGIQCKANDDDRIAVEKSLEMCDKAAGKGARFVCAGEFMITTEGSANGPLLRKYREKAKQKKIYIITSLITPVKKRIYAALIDPKGTITGVYEKTHGGRGKTLPVYRTKFCTLGMMICYDAVFPEVARAYALQGAEILFSPTASSFPDDDYFFTCLKARAIENSLFVAGINRYGSVTSRSYAGSEIYGRGSYYNFGRSVIFGPNGQILAQANAVSDEIIYADIDPEKVRSMRKPGESPQIHAPLCDLNRHAFKFIINKKKLTATDIVDKT